MIVPTIDKAKSIHKGLIYSKILFPAVGALLLATQTGCSQHASELGMMKHVKKQVKAGYKPIQEGLNCCSSSQDEEELSRLSSKKLGKKFLCLSELEYNLNQFTKSISASAPKSDLDTLCRAQEIVQQEGKKCSSLLCAILTSNVEERCDVSSVTVSNNNTFYSNPVFVPCDSIPSQYSPQIKCDQELPKSGYDASSGDGEDTSPLSIGQFEEQLNEVLRQLDMLYPTKKTDAIANHTASPGQSITSVKGNFVGEATLDGVTKVDSSTPRDQQHQVSKRHFKQSTLKKKWRKRCIIDDQGIMPDGV